ncbi:MAG: GFA family protein [Nitrospiraceae bacterium]
MTRVATCVCQQLRVSCEGDPESVSLCHCLACQRRTGSHCGLAAFFNAGHILTFGCTKLFTRSSDNGHSVTFHFCPQCGSTVYWEPQRKPNIIAVAVGAFADVTFPPPTRAFYRQFQHPWCEFPF